MRKKAEIWQTCIGSIQTKRKIRNLEYFDPGGPNWGIVNAMPCNILALMGKTRDIVYKKSFVIMKNARAKSR